MPAASFHTPWKHQEHSRFLMFLRGIESDQCHEMGQYASLVTDCIPLLLWTMYSSMYRLCSTNFTWSVLEYIVSFFTLRYCDIFPSINIDVSTFTYLFFVWMHYHIKLLSMSCLKLTTVRGSPVIKVWGTVYSKTPQANYWKAIHRLFLNKTRRFCYFCT